MCAITAYIYIVNSQVNPVTESFIQIFEEDIPSRKNL